MKKCNVTYGWCGAFDKNVKLQCCFWGTMKDVLDCEHRKRMNRFQKKTIEESRRYRDEIQGPEHHILYLQWAKEYLKNKEKNA